MSLVWREQLSVGNDAIDTDHKYLIGLVNRIEESMKAMNGKVFLAALDDLSGYSREHFAREERIAHAAGYPQIGRLSLSHEMLFRELDQARRDAAKTAQEWQPAAVDHFNEFLRNWLIGHVIKEDLPMKASLQNYPADYNPE